ASALVRPPPRPPLWPYTTLSRSDSLIGATHARRVVRLQREHVRGLEHIAGLIQAPPADHVAAGEQLGLVFIEPARLAGFRHPNRSEVHTSELQSRENLLCRLLLQ